MVLPRRCPTPALCGSSWHWTKNSRDSCQLHQRKRNKRLAAESKNLRPPDPFEKERIEQCVEAVKNYNPTSPTGSADIILHRNGERQLLALNPSDISTVGLLTASEIYPINELLRNKGKLEVTAGPWFDMRGYTSKQHFVDTACAVFNNPELSLELDEPIKLFRGIGFPANSNKFNFDVAEINQYLRTGEPWTEIYVDAGFSFAATNPDTAKNYNGSKHFPFPVRPILLELEAFRGLCIPHQTHRTVTLFEHICGIDFLDAAIGQVIFPPGTQWEVNSIDRHSKYGVPLVRMHQIMPCK